MMSDAGIAGVDEDVRNEGMPGEDVEGSISTNELQDLARKISSLGSPTKIAAFIMGIKDDLEHKNRDIMAQNQDLSAQNVDLSNKLLEYKNTYEKQGTIFTCFPKLPAELRAKVWQYAMPAAPRLIELHESEDGDFGCPWNHHPSILHVNKEARGEVLRKYPLCLDSVAEIPRFFNHECDALYISHEICSGDNFCIGTDRFKSNLGSGAGFDTSRLRYLALHSLSWDKFDQILIHDLGLFPRLEEIILMYSSTHFETGPLKLLEDEGDIIQWPRDADGYTKLDSYDYLRAVVKAFTKPLQKIAFEVQSGKELGDMENPWLAKDRKVPRIRLMKMVSDEESKFEMFDLDFPPLPEDTW